MDDFIKLCSEKRILISHFPEQERVVITYKNRKAQFKASANYSDKYQILKDLLILASITAYGTVTDLKGFVKFSENFGVLYPESYAEWKREQQGDKNAPSPLMEALTIWLSRHGDAHLLHALLQNDYQDFDQLKYL